jgi:hypothetical protein
VFALEQLFILFVVLDKAAAGIDLLRGAAHMAFATLLGITVDHHSEAARGLRVQTARAVALFTANARLGPGSHNAR